MIFNSAIRRVGFPCIWVQKNPKGFIQSVQSLNVSSTTLTWINKQQNSSKIHQKMHEIVKSNLHNTLKMIQKIGTLDNQLRMLRISSQLLPFYTLQKLQSFWKSVQIKNIVESYLLKIGEKARQKDIRLSFHPGQFVVLASQSDQIVQNSIKQLQYHGDLARMMGYGKVFQDLKINIHISGKKGPQGFISTLSKLSKQLRNTLTVQNDEITWGLQSTLKVKDHLPLVLDVHHHWVATGQYIKSNDDRVKLVQQSWKGLRPVVHYSMTREDGSVEKNKSQLLDKNNLLSQGYNKVKLRAHSDFYYNQATNKWMRQHWQWADIMCEAKAKNLASFQLYEKWKNVQNSK